MFLPFDERKNCVMNTDRRFIAAFRTSENKMAINSNEVEFDFFKVVL